MPALWRTVQQLRKGGSAGGSTGPADHQTSRRSSVASPQKASAAVASPERNGFLSPRVQDSLPGEAFPLFNGTGQRDNVQC